jgi:hypothetical protein
VRKKKEKRRNNLTFEFEIVKDEQQPILDLSSLMKES